MVDVSSPDFRHEPIIRHSNPLFHRLQSLKCKDNLSNFFACVNNIFAE